MHTYLDTLLLLLFLTHYYLLDQLKTWKVKFFILPSFIPSLMFFLSLCRYDLLTYIIFLFPETHLIFLNGRPTGNKYLQILLAWESFYFSFAFYFLNIDLFISPSLLKDNFTRYRILALYIFHFGSMVSKEKLGIILIFAPL